MAKLILNGVLSGISGKVGNVVFRRSQRGTTILSKCPDMSNVQWSDAQRAHRQRFKQAVAYAKAAMAQPGVRAYYEEQAAALNKRPFDVAVSDHFKGRNLLEPGSAP